MLARVWIQASETLNHAEAKVVLKTVKRHSLTSVRSGAGCICEHY